MTEHVVERIIREAIERGEFDGLSGAGRPLDLSDLDDPDWWVKRYAKREGIDLGAGLPDVFTLRRERSTFPLSLLDLTEAGARAVLEDYNRRVKEDRLRSTRTGVGPPPVIAGLVDVEEMMVLWAQARDARAATAATLPQPPPTTEPAPPAGARRWWARWRRGRPRPAGPVEPPSRRPEA